MASEGLRALGVARSVPTKGHVEEHEVQWELVGMLSLLDPPRPDSGQTITECNHHGLLLLFVVTFLRSWFMFVVCYCRFVGEDDHR